MSSFLGFDSYLVPLGASIADAHNAIKNALTSRGWQAIADDTSTTPTTLDLIPPATETVGGNGAFEFLRLRFSATTITAYALKKWTTALPQQVYMSNKTAGAVTVSCTLDGSTVSYTGTSTNAAKDNLAGLYAAIRDSSDPKFTAWDWDMSYPAPQNADDPAFYIFGKNKTAEANKTFAVNANINGGILCDYTPAGFILPEAAAQSPYSITIDLVSGFIYYLQINARGIALATKTNANFFGPIHAVWGNHAAALAYMPSDSEYASPIELLVGVDDPANQSDSWGNMSTFWILPQNATALPNYATDYQWASPSKGLRRHRFTDCFANSATRNVSGWGSGGPVNLGGSGLFWNDDTQVGNDFQIHRVKTLGYRVTAGVSMSGGNEPFPLTVLPGFEMEDWFKFRGTATNENLVLIADTVAIAKLAANYTPGDTTISLLDASSLQPSGFVIIGNEALQYTGKSGNTLTGVTGAKYATSAARHFANDVTCQGLWFVVINGGALFCGFNKPS